MKMKALPILLIAAIAASVSCADDVLNICTECYNSTTQGTEEFCGGPVAVEAFENSMETDPDWSCTRK